MDARGNNPVLIVADVDDTMVNTTVDLQNGMRGIECLTPVPGVLKFAGELYPKQMIAMSIADDRGRQIQKLRHVGLFGLLGGRIVMGNLESKREMLWAVSRKFRARGYLLVGVGDRLDNDIALFNEFGMPSFRMMVKGGKYRYQTPQDPGEVPYAVVSNWFGLHSELQKLLLTY